MVFSLRYSPDLTSFVKSIESTKFIPLETNTSQWATTEKLRRIGGSKEL